MGLAAWWQPEKSDSNWTGTQQTASSLLGASPSAADDKNANSDNNAMDPEGQAAAQEPDDPGMSNAASTFLEVAPLDVAELRQLDERIAALSESVAAIEWSTNSTAMEQALEENQSPAGVDEALSDIRAAIERLDQELTRSP
jgi:hypothetical protein